VYHFINNDEKKSRIASNHLVSRQGYRMFRNDRDTKYTAVVAYARLRKEVYEDSNINKLSKQEMIEIIEGSIKFIFNSVIFDPLQPMPHPTEMCGSVFNNNQKFFDFFRIGRPVELFNFFSPISLSGMAKNIKNQIKDINLHNPSNYKNKNELVKNIHFLSLIERVMIDEIIEPY